VTEFLDVKDGRLAYEVAGTGPLVVLAPGIGDRRQAYRFLAPQLVAAGYRVAWMDPRGQGESSAEWPEFSRAALAGDLLALVRELGGPAVLVGHSFAGGAVTIAATREPDLVSAAVEIAPFTRVPKTSIGGLFTNRAYRKGAVRIMGTLMGSVGRWSAYLTLAYPGLKPADWDAELAALKAVLHEPGRMPALRKMLTSDSKQAQAQLASVHCPTLVVMGTLDPDWPDPNAEAAAIVAALPAGVGSVAMIEGAGHYPHAQFPHEVARAVLTFLGAHTGA